MSDTPGAAILLAACSDVHVSDTAGEDILMNRTSHCLKLRHLSETELSVAREDCPLP